MKNGIELSHETFSLAAEPSRVEGEFCEVTKERLFDRTRPERERVTWSINTHPGHRFVSRGQIGAAGAPAIPGTLEVAATRRGPRRPGRASRQRSPGARIPPA